MAGQIISSKQKGRANTTKIANIRGICQLLFKEKITNLLDRAIDLWSYSCPLPLPETSKHIVDHYIYRQHPELDPESAIIEDRPNARMAVAQYDCWTCQSDSQGHVTQPKLGSIEGVVNKH